MQCKWDLWVDSTKEYYMTRVTGCRDFDGIANLMMNK